MESEQNENPELTFYEKINQVREAMGFMEFDSTNTGQGYKYVSAAAIIRKFQKELTKHGIVCYVQSEPVHHQVIVVGRDDEESSDGKSSKSHSEKVKYYAVVKLVLQLTDGANNMCVWSAQGSGVDSGDKAVGKANTMAYKYAIAHGLQLAWGAEDPEGDPSSDGPTVASVKKAIQSAKTAEALNDAKHELLSLRGDINAIKYNALAMLYKQRSQEF